MTKEEWNYVENTLLFPYRRVELNIDGFKVALFLGRVSTYKNAIFVYINNFFTGTWLLNECEERRRFLQKRTTSLFKKSKLKKYNKKIQKELYEKKMDYYLPYWVSFNSLKKHLVKNNECIELVSKIEF